MDAWLKWSLIVAALFGAFGLYVAYRNLMQDRRLERERLARLKRRPSAFDAVVDALRERAVIRASDKPRWLCPGEHEHEWIDHMKFGSMIPDRTICRICGIYKPEVTSEPEVKMPPNLGGIGNPPYQGPGYFDVSADGITADHRSDEQIASGQFGDHPRRRQWRDRIVGRKLSDYADSLPPSDLGSHLDETRRLAEERDARKPEGKTPWDDSSS